MTPNKKTKETKEKSGKNRKLINSKMKLAAFHLARGVSQKEAGKQAKVSERTIRNYLKRPEFGYELERQTELYKLEFHTKAANYQQQALDYWSENLSRDDRTEKTKNESAQQLMLFADRINNIRTPLASMHHEILQKDPTILAEIEQMSPRLKGIWLWAKEYESEIIERFQNSPSGLPEELARLTNQDFGEAEENLFLELKRVSDNFTNVQAFEDYYTAPIETNHNISTKIENQNPTEFPSEISESNDGD